MTDRDESTDRDKATGDGRVFVFHGYEVADRDGDGVFMPTDCDDTDASVGGPAPFWLDEDGDGYGSVAAAVCPGRPGYVALGEGCDEDEANVNPGAQEKCDKDNVDQDCDGLAEDDDPSRSETSTATWYADADGEGFGDAASTKAACDPPDGYVSNTEDCDDGAFSTYPGAAEVPSDGIDQDCDGIDAPGGGTGGNVKGCASAPGAAGLAVARAALATRRRQRARGEGRARLPSA